MNLPKFKSLFKTGLSLDDIVNEDTKKTYVFHTFDYKIIVTFDREDEMKAIDVVSHRGQLIFKIVRYKSFPFCTEDATEENRPVWDNVLRLVRGWFPEI